MRLEAIAIRIEAIAIFVYLNGQTPSQWLDWSTVGLLYFPSSRASNWEVSLFQYTLRYPHFLF